MPDFHPSLVTATSQMPRSTPTVSPVGFIGLIDSDYRNEWIMKIRHKGHHGVDDPITIVHGERIAQAIPVVVPRAVIRVVESLPESGRSGGFGSTGIM